MFHALKLKEKLLGGISIILLLMLVMGAVVTTYRAVMPGLLVLIVLGLAMMLNRAFMSLRDIGLNVNTLPVTSVGVGVGADGLIARHALPAQGVHHSSSPDSSRITSRVLAHRASISGARP